MVSLDVGAGHLVEDLAALLVELEVGLGLAGDRVGGGRRVRDVVAVEAGDLVDDHVPAGELVEAVGVLLVELADHEAGGDDGLVGDRHGLLVDAEGVVSR